MTTRPDPLAAPSLEGPERLNYVQGTLLDADDFSDEQLYHRGRLARGLEYLFGPGTAAGLDIVWEATTQEIAVTPGLALDPLGRLIEVPRRQCIRIREWFAAQRAEDLARGWIDEFGVAVLIADIFIRFRVRDQGKTQKFAEDQLDLAPSRLRDDFELGLVIREEAGARREALESPPPPPAVVPVIPTPDADEIALGLPPGQLGPIHQRILDLWRDEASDWRGGSPPRLREHLAPRVSLAEADPSAIGRDPTALMLGRLAIPVDPHRDTDGIPTDRREAPLFDEASPIEAYRTGKFIRRFVHALGHLTRPVE